MLHSIRLATFPSCLILALQAHAQVSLLQVSGTHGAQQLGRSAAVAGDVNADGYPDYILGGPGYPASGVVSVISGLDGSVLYRWTGVLPANTFSLDYGFSVAGIGDVDHDGFDDVAIGARDDMNTFVGEGSVQVRSGRTGQVLYTVWGGSIAAFLGQAVAAAGDVNGDGYPDFIAGAPQDSTNGHYAGMARIYSGRDGSVLYTFLGTHANDGLGFAVANAGDVNGDGVPDAVVGAWLGGYAVVLSGRNGSVIRTLNGDASSDRFGSSVAGAGDIDHDGYADVLVGAPLNDASGSDAGEVKLFSGATGQLLASYHGTAAGGQFGLSVAGGTDLDGDGTPDILVGAPMMLLSRGVVYAISGATGRVLRAWRGNAVNFGLFGVSLGFAADVDHDGHPDVIIGAPFDDLGVGRNSGVVRIFSGYR
jgi:hypothetical protein